MKYAIEIYRAVCLAGIVAVCLMCAGCSTPKVVTVTEYRERVQTDTLRKVDSVYVAHYVWQKGDTVRLTDTICQYRILRDVREVVVRDSVPYPVEVVREVVVRSEYDKAVSRGFWVLLIGIFIAIALRVAKWLYWRK